MAFKQINWMGQTGYFDPEGSDPNIYSTPYGSGDARIGTNFGSYANTLTNPNASWQDLLKGSFQRAPGDNYANWMYGTGGGQGYDLYGNLVNRINATGWDDATKKSAVQKAIENHYGQYGSGFTEWSTPEGIAGLLGLPDYKPAVQNTENQAFSQQHEKAAQEADADSFSNALTIGGGLLGAWMGPGGGWGDLFGGGAGGLEELASLTGSGGSGGAGVGGFGGFGGAEAAWGVNPQGGSMDGIFDYTPEYQYLGDATPGNYFSGTDFTNLAPTQNLGAGSFFNGASTGGAAGGLLDVLRQATGLGNKELLNLGGKGIAALLQAYSSNQQSNALTGLADRYSASGAPSRARFEASMTPGFDPMSIPGYKGALDTASESLLARLSAQGGNPFGNPQGLIQANKQIVNGTALPAINEYQRLNLGAGGLANLNAAIPSLQTSAIGQDAGGLAALGSFLGSATAPDNSLASILRQLQGLRFNDGTGLS